MVIVFGSLNIDLVARVAALPQAGETVLGSDYVAVPGGKGANQALAARRAGAEVVMVGAVGRDAFADAALAALAADGVDVSRVARADAPTGAAFIAVDEAGRNQIVVAPGANALASARALEGLDPAHGILMLQWEVPEPEILAAARWGRAKNLTVMLNRAPAGPVPRELLELIDVLILNEHEAMALVEGDGVDYSRGGFDKIDLDGVASGLSAAFGLAVAVTLGAEGSILWADGICHSAPALPINVVDTTAAGDAFCGAFAAARARKRGFETCVDFATAAGSLACTGFGAQPSLPTREAIEPAALGLAEKRNPANRRTYP